MQAPRVDRELPDFKPVLVEPGTSEYRDQFPFEDDEDVYDDGFYRGNELPSSHTQNRDFEKDLKSRKVVRVNKAGKTIKPRSKSEWNKFVQKVSKWQSLSTMGTQKMKALSILYAEAQGSDLKQFVKLEFISPAEMKHRLEL